MVSSPHEPWPEDPAFRMLARRVRDGVMLARHMGMVISRDRGSGCCCPLGAALLLGPRSRVSSHPGPSWFLGLTPRGAAEEAVPDEAMLWAFICGFEEGIESASHNYAVKAAGRLGIVYRERYLKKRSKRFDPRPRRTRLNLTKKASRR